jgi:hypothetical protein
MQAPQGVRDGRKRLVPETNLHTPRLPFAGPELNEFCRKEHKERKEMLNSESLPSLCSLCSLRLITLPFLSCPCFSPCQNHTKTRVNTLKYAYARVNARTGEKLFPTLRVKAPSVQPPSSRECSSTNIQSQSHTPLNVAYRRLPSLGEWATRSARPRSSRLGCCELGASLDVGAWTLGAYRPDPPSNL